MPDDPKHDPAAPPGPLAVAGIIIMSIVVLAFSGYMIVTYSSTRPTTTAANPPAQTGFAPIVDEVRPVPSTTGQGGGERR